MIMKKLLIVLLLALAAVGFVSAQTPTYGAPAVADPSDTESLDITANVLKQMAVDITATENDEFTLDTNGLTTGLTVGNAVVVSNYRAWELAVHSTNGSKLNRDDTGDTNGATGATTAFIPYTFNFEPVAGSAHVTAFTVSTPYSLVSSAPTSGNGYYLLTGKTPRAGETLAMNIFINPEDEDAFWDAGVYTDTITVTVSAI
jgi:hypothetical protein